MKEIQGSIAVRRNCTLLQTVHLFSQGNQTVLGHMHVDSLCNASNPEGLVVNYCKRRLGSQLSPNGDTVATR